jgi:putative addiction module antidote
MSTAKVTSIGDSPGIVLPPEMLARLQARAGTELQVSETANGVELIRCKNELARQIAVAEKVMSEDRAVLQKLAE